MTISLERNGTLVLPGLWKLKKDIWVIRAQRRCPKTKRKINRRRVLRDFTKTEAVAALERLRADLQEESFSEEVTSVITSPATTLQVFATSWLNTKLERKDLAENTEKRYGYALDRLSPWLLATPLSELSRSDIQKWMGASRKKFAATTVNSWLRVLRACLADAVADGLMAKNPALQVKPLREDLNLEDDNSLSAQELGKLLGAMSGQNHVLHAAATTQAFTGLRWGEVTALKWEDFDEQAKVLRIRRGVCERKLKSVTKTRKARTVGTPEMLIDVLKQLRNKLIADQHSGLSSGLMFPSNAGTPLSSGRISDALRDARKAAGIRKRFTSHGFRRSLTDLLREAEVDPVVAAGLTGHETERMRRHYSTVRDAEAARVGERVAQLVRVQPLAESEPDPEQPNSESDLESEPGVRDPKHEKAGNE